MLRDLIPTSSRSISRSENDPFTSLRRAMDRIFDDYLGDFAQLSPATWSESLREFSPHLDLEEKDDKVILSAELPGMSEKDVKVEVNKDYLTIKGEKKSEHEEKGKNRYFCERRYGSFERIVRLPSEVNKDKIAASMKDGVLTVTIPKMPGAKMDVKQVPVQH